MKKIVTLIVIVLITSTFLAGSEFEKGFGLSLGMISGFGTSYRYVNEIYGFQATYGGGGNDSYTIHSIGLELIKPIHSIQKTRFNIAGGFGTLIRLEDDESDRTMYSFGVGPEVEITFSGNMRFIIGLPLTFTFRSDDDNRLVTFMPAFSILYFFK